MPDYILDGRLWEAKLHIVQFNALVDIFIIQEGDGRPTSRQLEALAAVQNIDDETILMIQNCAIEHYRKVDSIVNLAEDGITIDEATIDNHYRIKSILIPEIRSCKTNFCFLSFQCDWEEEHGLQVLLANGETVISGDHGSLPFSPQWIHAISIPEFKLQIHYIRSISRACY
jgi:hypothetical protein